MIFFGKQVGLELIFGFAIILIFFGWSIYYIFFRKKEKINEYTFDFIPHLFPTLGILFTFLGITFGLWDFDSSKIEKSIPELMNGLTTAFLVSMIGVFLLVIFSFIVNWKKHKLEKDVLSPETLAINNLIEIIKELKNDFYFTDENGNLVKPGNVYRDIYQESKKQSNALQSFSTDLSITISAGFEQILNNPVEGVVAELKLLRLEIDKLGQKLQDPATNMTQNIVKELQESIGKMVEEFKTTMSASTKNELEKLATLLGQAGGSLLDFPIKLQAMTDNLNTNFRNLQEVVNSISQQTLNQSNESTNLMKQQVEEMGKILSEQVGGLQTGQKTLIYEQSKNMEISEKLLTEFNSSIEKMKGMSISVNETILQLNQSHNELEKVITNFRNISQEVNSSSYKFGESQVMFSQYSNEFLIKNDASIKEIQNSLSLANNLYKDYINKFEIIENGMQNIFGQINIGLTDYQKTVKESLEQYLSKYTEHLTKTAESLASASAKQEEILEDLTEQLDKFNSRR